MRQRWFVAVSVVLLLGSITGCGDDTPGSAPDPADAASCADLAEKYAEMTEEVVDLIGDRSDADMQTPPADIEAAGERWVQTTFVLVPRIGELCDEGEFDRLLCERRSAIEPGGEAGERFLRDNFPSCTGTDSPAG